MPISDELLNDMGYESAEEAVEAIRTMKEAMSVLRHYGYPTNPVRLDRKLLLVDGLKVAAEEYVKKLKED